MARKFLTPINVASLASPPATGSTGDIYYNTADKKLYTYNGTNWVAPSNIFPGPTAPASPSANDFWFDSANGDLYIYYADADSSQWVSAGPPMGPTGPSVTGPTGPTGPAGPTGSNTLLALTDTTITSPSAGESLVYNGTSWVNRPESGRNLLYNGAMQVHQRGASQTGTTTTGYYTADRWQTNLSSAGTWTQTVENDAPTGSGFRKSFKITCTTAKSTLSSTDALYIVQALEGQDVQRLKKGTSAAESITLSFWVKSNVTGTYVAVLYDNDNNRAVGRTYSISTSETWQKVSMTMPPDTTGAFDNDNAASLLVYHYLAAGSSFTSGALPTVWESALSVNIGAGQVNLASATSNYWQITGVQLEAGASESPFDFKSLSQELTECQRYYYRTQAGLDHRMPGYARSTTLASVYTPFPVTMRINPTALEQTGTAGNYGVVYVATGAVCSAVPTFLSASTDSATSTFTLASGLTAGQGIMGYTTFSTAGFLGWSAEL